MKNSFKNLVGKDSDLNTETRVKVEWEPIKLQTEEPKPVIRKSGLKSLKESLGIETKPKEEVQIEVPVLDIPIDIPILNEVIEQKVEPKKEIVEEVFIQPEPVLPKSVIQKAAEYIAKEAKVNESLYQNPNPPIVDKNFNEVTNKIKQLETWLGKIASHGPGGGDANPHDVIEFLDRGVRFTPTPRMMYWNNTEDCLNITQADGSTLQVGLENYIRVYNNTANTFANGTFVEFTGVDADGDAPTFRAYVNDANAQPLYSIGVLTTDVLSNTHGRATVLGLVRNIDTTGNAVGEVWSNGDILWANPSYPGNYTKVKPTAPNIAISVAAVTSVDETEGIILVRPTIWPRLRYGDFFSTTTQAASAPNQDTRLAISNTLISSGFTLSGNTVIALDSGLYKFQSRVQIVSSSSNSKSIVLWYKKNGVNVERSAVRQSISENGGYRTITNFQVISLDAGDNVSVHFAVTDTSLTVAAPETFGGAANVPSIQLAVTEAAL